MKPTTLKKIWTVAKYTGLSTLIFWLLETLFFLVLEGWHWQATTIYEKRCDQIVIWGGFMTFFITLFVVTEVTSFIIDELTK